MGQVLKSYTFTSIEELNSEWKDVVEFVNRIGRRVKIELHASAYANEPFPMELKQEYRRYSLTEWADSIYVDTLMYMSRLRYPEYAMLYIEEE